MSGGISCLAHDGFQSTHYPFLAAAAWKGLLQSYRFINTLEHFPEGQGLTAWTFSTFVAKLAGGCLLLVLGHRHQPTTAESPPDTTAFPESGRGYFPSPDPRAEWGLKGHLVHPWRATGLLTVNPQQAAFWPLLVHLHCLSQPSDQGASLKPKAHLSLTSTQRCWFHRTKHLDI